MFHIPLPFPKGDNSDFKPAGLYNHGFAQVYLLLEIFSQVHFTYGIYMGIGHNTKFVIIMAVCPTEEVEI